MNIIKYPERKDWQQILKRPYADSKEVQSLVQRILDDVKATGDSALNKYTKLYDGLELDNLLVKDEDWNAADSIDAELKAAIQQAIKSITTFHSAQVEERKVIETFPGITCWRKSVGIERVGLYIPGGSAPLFSTLLMLAIPAVLAGCKEIIVCTPPDKQGNIHPAILYAAAQLGITGIYKAGGAQAIAAMAYGTHTIPNVYKIFGPGNQYITAAKMLLCSQGFAIDMPAGPSEVAILADDSCIPEYVAADLLSQAEHGPDSQVILVSNNENVLTKVLACLDTQLAALGRKNIATAALNNSRMILVNDLAEGIELLNEYAPEHLIIACKDAETIGEQVVNAGSVFLGNYAAEAGGDYATGTNHTLPTNGFAKAYSGVSVDSFVKKITFQKVTREGLAGIAGTVTTMAQAEGLDAHANAIIVRLK
ncbi:MAG: histidinol dehydrogenase [Flavipsychrobacter sp.]|nr:histidinol dehydrogenase [Flavipsychrobacter sp.]